MTDRIQQQPHQPTPVITRTATEWDNLRTELGYRPADEVAAELEARKAAWSQQRKAYEAAQDQAHAEAQEQQARLDRVARVRHLGRLATDALRSVVTPATLITDKATQQPTPGIWSAHSPFPYGTACNACHHTSVHATQAEADQARATHADACTASLPQAAQAAIARLEAALATTTPSRRVIATGYVRRASTPAVTA